MNIYLACSLTHVPRPFFKVYSQNIHSIAKALKNQGNIVRYALLNSDPQLATRADTNKAQLCYLWDKQMVEESDLVIAEASFPSTGLGIELQIAESNKIPIIIFFKDYGDNKALPVCYENPDHKYHDLQIGEGFVSLMALGLPNILKVIKYKDQYHELINAIDSLQITTKGSLTPRNKTSINFPANQCAD